EIRKAAPELVGEIARRHTVAARRDILGAEDSRLKELARKILIRIVRHFAVGSEESGFRAENNLITQEAFSSQLLQRSADGAFASLQAIIDGGVHHIDAAFHGGYDGARVGSIGWFIRITEIRPDPDRGKDEPARYLAKMPRGGASLEPRGVAQGALCSGATWCALAMDR